jgi:hypothetical protein
MRNDVISTKNLEQFNHFMCISKEEWETFGFNGIYGGQTEIPAICAADYGIDIVVLWRN